MGGVRKAALTAFSKRSQAFGKISSRAFLLWDLAMTVNKPPPTETPNVKRISYHQVHETKEGRQNEDAYYEALGRFVQMFAEAEAVVAQTLWAYAGTQPEVSKIVFAGTQTEHGSNYIKAIAKAINASADHQADLEDVFQQFGIIRGARNDILHYGATGIAEGQAVVSNAWKAKDKPKVFPISPLALSEMTEDCRKIILHLAYGHLGRPRPKGQATVLLLVSVLQSPWRYKHPPQSSSKTNPPQSVRGRNKRPKPPHQRGSSPA